MNSMMQLLPIFSAVCKFRVPANQTDGIVCSNKSCPSHISGHSLSSAPPSSSYMGPSLTASDLVKWDDDVGGVSGRAVADFNLLVSFADCTGELEGVWLAGQAARDLLNILVSLPPTPTCMCRS